MYSTNALVIYLHVPLVWTLHFIWNSECPCQVDMVLTITFHIDKILLDNLCFSRFWHLTPE